MIIFFTSYFRNYQKKCSRDTAEKGAECIAKLTGPGREKHTVELADALNNDVDQNEKDNDIEITQPQINDILDDVDDMVENSQPNERVPGNSSDGNSIGINHQSIEEIPSTSTGTTSDLMGELENIMQPKVCVQRMNVEEGMCSKLIVSDNIEVKREELEGVKRVVFTEEEDSFIKAGIIRYKNSKTKWADILKDEEYKFHAARTRDALRVRSSYLRSNSRSKRRKTNLNE